MSMVRRVCPLCSGPSLGVYIEGLRQAIASHVVGSSRTEVSIGRILRCRECRFGFLEVPPSETELAESYRQMNTAQYNAEGNGRSKTAEAHLHIVHKYVRNANRLLDVGCASGLFLQHAINAGWDVVGVEPSQELYRAAQQRLGPQAAIYGSTLQSIILPPASFDAITLWDVLEHVFDPVFFLKRCASLLRPGGHLFANVPDLDSLQSRILGSRWPLLLPEHLNYFNRRSLQLCGNNAGLQWVASCRRPAAFSLGYVLFRLEQHQVPGVSYMQKFVRSVGQEDRLLSVHLGELCGVWTGEAIST